MADVAGRTNNILDEDLVCWESCSEKRAILETTKRDLRFIARDTSAVVSHCTRQPGTRMDAYADGASRWSW